MKVNMKVTNSWLTELLYQVLVFFPIVQCCIVPYAEALDQILILSSLSELEKQLILKYLLHKQLLFD